MPTSVIIALSIASLVLAGAGLFINKIWRDSERASENMNKSIIDLNEQITRLGMSITALNGTVMSQDMAYSDFKITVCERLKKHGEQIDEHDKQIAILGTKINK